MNVHRYNIIHCIILYRLIQCNQFRYLQRTDLTVSLLHVI